MAAPDSQLRERLTATVVMAVAVSLAAWIVLDTNHAVVAKPIPPKETAAVKPQPPIEEKKPILHRPIAVELIDLSAIAAPAPPAPRIASPPPPAPRIESPPPPEPVRVASVPVPTPAEVLKPTTPPPPEPPKAIKPLQPTQAAPRPAPPPVEPLRTEIKQAPPTPPRVEPLKVGIERPKEQKEQPRFTPRKFEPEPPRPAPSPPKDTHALLAAAARIEKSEPVRPAVKPAVITGEAVNEGRALLRILEQGSGPSIEIGWPDESRERNKLYQALKSCLGMRTGLLDDSGRLYLGEGVRGQATELNTDKYSGFVRRPEGAIAGDERAEITHVRTYHTPGSSAAPARIFPRRVDAFLIGGLRQAVGDNYLSLKSIRASYRLENGRVMVDRIAADGRGVGGVIDLSGASNGCSG